MLNQNWQTNPLNIAIRIKTNMNRGGFEKNFYVDNVTLPNGINLTGGGYGSALLAGSPINATVPLGAVTASAANPSAAQGGLITFDCDYRPANDAVRTRPALVQNVKTLADCLRKSRHKKCCKMRCQARLEKHCQARQARPRDT